MNIKEHQNLASVTSFDYKIMKTETPSYGPG